MSRLGEMKQKTKEANYQNALEKSLSNNKKYNKVIEKTIKKIKEVLSPKKFDTFCIMLKESPRDVLEYFNEKNKLSKLNKIGK